MRAIDVLVDREVIATGKAIDQPWKFYDLGHGYCTYDFFDQCPHRMACAKCSFYLPKGSTQAQLLEGKANLLRMRQEIPLREAELAAIDDGVAAFEKLLVQLADVPTPAGPTPRQLLVLFNLCRAVHHGKRVVIVEGFFDCFKVHQAGVPCVVALMGCSLSHRQIDLLEQHFSEAILLLDGDKAGRAASATIAAQLVPKLSTRLLQVPEGSQPDQLSVDQIRCLCIPGYF